MQMTEDEIREKYRKHGGKSKSQQKRYMEILADLNCISVEDVFLILDGKDVPEKHKTEVSVETADARLDKPKTYKARKNAQRKENRVTGHEDGIIEVIVREALVCYICSLREDNERLRGLRRRGCGNRYDVIGSRIEVNEQKISLLKRLCDRWIGGGCENESV